MDLAVPTIRLQTLLAGSRMQCLSGVSRNAARSLDMSGACWSLLLLAIARDPPLGESDPPLSEGFVIKIHPENPSHFLPDGFQSPGDVGQQVLDRLHRLQNLRDAHKL